MQLRPILVLSSVFAAVSAAALVNPQPVAALSAPAVSSVSPRSGPVAGGTRVTVIGARFRHVKWVHFGASAGTSVRVLSRTRLLVTSPAHAAGVVDVRVKTSAGRSPARAVDRFTYVSPPAVLSLSPTSGSTTGGGRITVTGAGFQGVRAVLFGASAGTSVSVLSPTRLQVTAPPHAAGVVGVRVSTAYGTSAVTTPARYTYGAPPTVAGVSPSTGPTKGGTLVTVTGSNFSGARSVTFGGVSGSGLSVVSSTSLTVLSPPHGAGVVDVRVITAFGTSPAGTPDRFTFAALLWSAPTLIQPDPADLATLADVSCGSASFCVAITKNGRAITYDGTGWSIPLVIDTASGTYGPAELTGVSCPSPSFCVAVDTLGNAIVYDGTDWATPTTVDDISDFPWLTAVSCASSSFCVAVDYDGYAVTFDGTSWTAPVYVETNRPYNHLEGVSCPESPVCLAVDVTDVEAHARALVFDSGTWSSPVPVAAATRGFVGVSCASASFCAAYDYAGHVLFTSDGTTWSTSTTIASLGDVSCTSVAFCLAVAGTSSRTYDGSAWSSPVMIDSNDWLFRTSCVAGPFCAAIDQHGYAVTTQ